ncbi:MAG: HigA family addiction module antidote protein [Elusimicrobiaceae bacterium]|nr:HigA family addiction module antidote protein [Elusimicrobiaceae bacterium]
MTEYFDLPSVGDILREEFMEPLNLSQNALAMNIGVPANRINGIINGTRGITADTDLRLTTYFGLSEGYFMRLQDGIKLTKARRKIQPQLAKIIPIDSLRKPRERQLMQG